MLMVLCGVISPQLVVLMGLGNQADVGQCRASLGFCLGRFLQATGFVESAPVWVEHYATDYHGHGSEALIKAETRAWY